MDTLVTKLMDKAIEAIRHLPETQQDELAQAMLAAANMPAVEYTPQLLAAIDEGIADADAGRFVSDDDVESLFSRFRPA